jgi:hypothetical protein
MRISSLVLSLALLAVPSVAFAQTASSPSAPSSDSWRVTLTVFRSPGTGLQLSKGHLAVFAGHYPTVIQREGEQRTTHFVRMGAAYYVAPSATTSPYASLSIAPSLTDGWSTSGLADVGVRRMFSRRYSGQLGVAMLHAPGMNATRVNPTIGFGRQF